MPSTLTRKQILQSAAQRVGNAAAHLAVYDDPSGTREAQLYRRQAALVIEQRGWNDKEIERFRQVAIRRAKKELRERMKKERELDFDWLLSEAVETIDEFIRKEMRH